MQRFTDGWLKGGTLPNMAKRHGHFMDWVKVGKVVGRDDAQARLNGKDHERPDGGRRFRAGGGGGEELG